MKKFLFAAILALIVAISANCSADYRFDSDPDYIWVSNAQGSFYLYLPGVEVQEYNPPHYQIAGNFVWTNGMSENYREIVIRYDFKRKETFSRDKNGYWRKRNIGTRDDSGVGSGASNRRFADALFRAAYGIDFYGY